MEANVKMQCLAEMERMPQNAAFGEIYHRLEMLAIVSAVGAREASHRPFPKRDLSDAHLEPGEETHTSLVTAVLAGLPDEVAFHEVLEEVETLAGIQIGFQEIDAGLDVPHEEVKRRLAKWLR